MGLKDWWKRRKELKEWQHACEIEYASLNLQEQRAATKSKKLDLKAQRIQLKFLKLEMERLKNKPKYIE